VAGTAAAYQCSPQRPAEAATSGGIVTPAFSTVRDEMEVQRAHDILEAVLLGHLPEVSLEGNTRELLSVCTDVLCWVLRHDHNTSFAENLAELEAEIAKCGYVLKQRLQ
jgi:hypothetical protein